MEHARALEQIRQIRENIVRMIAQAGSGHPGGSLSCVELLAALYLGGILAHDPAHPESPGRDRFILSKGHAAPALYAVLAEAGYFPPSELDTLRNFGSRLQGHPDSSLVPGIEVSTGSLGQGLSVGAGIACGARLNESDARTFVLLGDGECEEGQVWEAATFAAHQKLGNLVAIVDANGLQIDGRCCDVCASPNLDEKFAAFGFDVHTVDGHDYPAVVEKLAALRGASGIRPHVLIAETVKGKGVSFMENQAGWHGRAPDAEELRRALLDLGAKEALGG